MLVCWNAGIKTNLGIANLGIELAADTPQYHLPELPWLNTLHCPLELNGARRGRRRFSQIKNIKI